uniref:Uncharacterized protein n=1 Tax=Rhabditophanes sp. KR3021 TaxID=114890 RepID=A0AC35U1N4_9BILA
MTVDLRQTLETTDYFGPLAVCICFFCVIFIISVTCILWCCVTENDDSTVFSKWGMGPKTKANPREQKYTAAPTVQA